MLTFLTIFSVGLCGFAGAAPLSLAAAIAGMVSLAIHQRYARYQRYLAQGAIAEVVDTLWRSTTLSMILATFAYGLGLLLRLAVVG